MSAAEPQALFEDEVGAFGTGSGNRQLLFIAPICGFMPPLRETVSAVAASQSRHFSRIRLIEFPGQNGRPGLFSVRNSAAALKCLLQEEAGAEFTLFGMCSGATACVEATLGVPHVRNLILWEMSPRYSYDARHRRYYERRFDLSVCERSYLVPLQPVHLVPQLQCRTTYATASPSRYCDDAGQIELMSRTARATWRKVCGVTHLLEGSGGSSGIAELFD